MKIKQYIIVILMGLLLLSNTACSSSNTIENNNSNDTGSYIVDETEYFRSIMVGSYKGFVDVKRDAGEELQIYEGMSLNDGDDVHVLDHSDLTLNVDSDKHLYADENTHFWLIASGTEENTKTKIRLEEGSVLCQIKNKLADSEVFEVETPSSTMSVRGTVFRISLIKGLEQDIQYTLVEVFNGEVTADIGINENKVSLEPGECALVRENIADGSVNFVLSDQLDEDFWNSSSLDIKLISDEGEGSPILKISYEKISKFMLDSLVEISESGQDLAIEVEDLKAIQETGHNFVETVETVATCKIEGVIKKECSICGETITEILAKTAHNYSETGQKPTCLAEGKLIKKCSICGNTVTETLAKIDHKYTETKQEPTCKVEGKLIQKCEMCGNTVSTVLATLDHSPIYLVGDIICEICNESMYINSAKFVKDGIVFANSIGTAPLMLSDEAESANQIYATVPVDAVYKNKIDGKSSTKTLTIIYNKAFGDEAWRMLETADSAQLMSHIKKFETELLSELDSQLKKNYQITSLSYDDMNSLQYDLIESSEQMGMILRLKSATISCINAALGNYSYQSDIFVKVSEKSGLLDWDFALSGVYENPTGEVNSAVINTLNNKFVHEVLETSDTYFESLWGPEEIVKGNESYYTLSLDVGYRICGRSDCVYPSHFHKLDGLVADINASNFNDVTIDRENELELHWDNLKALIRSLLINYGCQENLGNHNHDLIYFIDAPLIKKEIKQLDDGQFEIKYQAIVEKTCKSASQQECVKADLLPYRTEVIYTGMPGDDTWTFTESNLQEQYNLQNIDMSKHLERVKQDIGLFD